MRIISYLFWLLIIALVVIFTIINSHVIDINFYFKSVRIYLPLLLFLILFLGSILGVLAMVPFILKLQNKIRLLKRRADQAEQEVSNLRSIPIKDKH